MGRPEPDRRRESRPADLGSRILLNLDDLPEYEDEDEELRKMNWRVRATRQDSLTRRFVTLCYVLALLWLAFELRIAWVGESYRPLRSGTTMVVTGTALWVQCLAPVFVVAFIFFRFDEASLRFVNRRGWAACFSFSRWSAMSSRRKCSGR
jgi:hypothetical protein